MYCKWKWARKFFKSSKDFIKVRVSAEKNILDFNDKEFRIIENPARLRLLVDEKTFLRPGWYLLKGQIKRNGRDFQLKLIIQNNSFTRKQFLPVTCKGTLLELIYIPKNVQEIYLEIYAQPGSFEFTEVFTLQPVSNLERIYRMYKRILFFFQKKFEKKRKILGLSFKTLLSNLNYAYELVNRIRDCSFSIDYQTWIRSFDELTEEDIKSIKRDIKKNNLKLFFIIFIQQSQNSELIKRTCKSLNEQLYKNFKFEILTKNFFYQIRDYLKLYNLENSYIILLKPGTLLRPHSLYWLAKAIETSKPDLIYSDHDFYFPNDKIERFNPWFKPDFSLELLRSMNYIDFTFAVKAEVFNKILNIINIGDVLNFDSHFLLFKIIESIPFERIYHIPALLFHLPPPCLYLSGELYFKNDPVNDHLKRLGVEANLELIKPFRYKVVYLIKKKGKISILIPTKNNLKILKRCIESILNKTTYSNFEIIVIDNQSEDKRTLKFYQSLSKEDKIRILRYDKPFNYSAMNNWAISLAQGDAVLFLNDDTEVITPEWLEVMLGCLEQPKVGAVGVKLLYPDGTIQHAGVVMGPGGCAEHVFKGLDGNASGYLDRAILQQDYLVVTAACMMTWKEVFFNLGGFDEVNLPINFNDVDYCLKLREAGYRVIFTPYVELYHHESLTKKRNHLEVIQQQSKREANFIRAKWEKYIKKDPFYNPNLNYNKPDFKLNPFPEIEKPWEV